MSYTTKSSVVANLLTLAKFKELRDSNALNSSELYSITDFNEYVSECYYICNGSSDNVKISNIVKAFLNANASDDKTLILHVIGEIGVSVAASGTGASNNAFKWFDFSANTTSRRVVLDFTSASRFTVTVANGTNNIIVFAGASDITVQGIQFVSDNIASGTKILGIKGTGNLNFENCRIWLRGDTDTIIAERGTYTNCRFTSRSRTGNGIVFSVTDYVLVNGGEYYAYTAGGTFGAVVYQNTASAVTSLHAVRFPTKAIASYTQTYAYKVDKGYLCAVCVISALTASVASGATSNVLGKYAVSK